MIRSLNIVLGVITVASGAWMFTVKHNTETLERKIAGVNQKIQHAQQKLVVLRATWAEENDPNRLAALAHQFLPQLKPMAPDQLVSWSQLAAQLPAPGSPPPGSAMPTPALLANATPPSPIPVTPAKADLAAAIAPQPILQANPHVQPVVRIVRAAPRRVQARAHQQVTHHPVMAAQRQPIAVRRLPTENPAPYSGRAVQPMGARVMSITAEATHPRGAVSVFGGYGANLPPPQPLAPLSGGPVP